MADWERRDAFTAARERRPASKSVALQERADLLQSIAAIRRNKLHRSRNAAPLPPDLPLRQEREHFEAESKREDSKLLTDPEGSGGISLDDGDDDTANSSFSALNLRAGLSQCVKGRPQVLDVSEKLRLERTYSHANAEGASEDEAGLSDGLSGSLSCLTLRGKHSICPGGLSSRNQRNELQSSFKEGGMPASACERKGFVQQKLTIEAERGSESSKPGSSSIGKSSFSKGCTSADDGDDGAPVLLNCNTGVDQAVLPPKLPPSTFNGFASKQGTEADMELIDGSRCYKLNAKIAKMLYPHQREGIKWLWGLHCKCMGGILRDDMGLGKTMQIASFLAGLFHSQLIKCALIVVPKTLIAQWAKELSTVGLARKTQDYSGTSAKAREFALQGVLQRGGVLITTYDLVRCHSKELRGDFTGRDGFGDTSEDIVTWDYIILDEGHLVKNPSTQRAKGLREIPAAHRLILSGTPIQNHLREMWALFDFCCPGLLGDRKEFKDMYERQILAGNDKHASDRQKRTGSAVAEELRQRFAPFFLRRLKSEVFPDCGDKADRKLSRKNDLIVWLRLSEFQQKIYKAFLNSEAAEQSWRGDSSALAALTVMKKICDHPSLLTKKAADDIAEGMEGILDSVDVDAAAAMTASLTGMVDDKGVQGAPSCKIVFLMALLENLVDEGHRTLIFAQTRKMLNIIQDEILDRGWCFRRIDGTIKAVERQQHVQDFQANYRISLFLLTSQVGGLGLTLTGADRVVIIDPAWNPSTDNQSVDRAYRIGQMKDVVVYRLMTCGTIEEKIYRKQVFKGGLMKVATENKEQMRYFSQQDLRELFTVPKTGFDVSLTQQQLHKEHASQHQIDEGLEEHIHFLESRGIAGVSHHDLLFSKAAEPLPPPGLDEQDVAVTWEPRNPAYTGQQFKEEHWSVKEHTCCQKRGRFGSCHCRLASLKHS